MSPSSFATQLTSLTPALSSIAVGPKGFKAALQVFSKFLIEHRIDATLWIKIPKDDAWWEDIWHYGQQAAGSTFYSLGGQTGTPPSNLAASLRAIPIEQTPELKREYFCLAVAPNFVGGLFAIRSAPGTPVPDKRTLKLFTTVSPKAIQAISDDIRAVLEANLSGEQPIAEIIQSAANSTDQSESETAIAAALSQWDRHFPAAIMSQPTSPLADTFVCWQSQQQENLRTQLRKNGKNPGLALKLAPDFLSQARQALQSPLTSIKTALTLLGSSSLKIAQRQRYLEMISDQCEHQKTLINSIIELLELQTAEREAPEPIKLADLIPGIVSTYQPIAEERGIMLAYTIPAAVSNVLAVEPELKQIVIHLIKNGIHITPQGGRVWVSAKEHSKDSIALSVQDSGQALSKGEIDQLFDAFSNTGLSPDQDNCGFGLPLVKMLVERMGGEISVESSPKNGTTFIILLPATQQAIEETERSREKSKTVVNQGPDVTVASDSQYKRISENQAAANANRLTASGAYDPR